MAYEIFNRRGGRTKAPILGISTYGRLGFNKGMVDIFNKNEVDKLLLLWDSEKHKIALKLLNKKETDPRAYEISFGTHSRSGYISAKLFLEFIEYHNSTHQSYPALWNEKEKTFEIEIPEEALKGRATPRSDV